MNREKLHEIIFEADTRAGKLFDIILLILILISVFVVMLDSVPSISSEYGDLFQILEWASTILFTIEYILRLYVVNKSYKYAISFFGVVDLLSILPTYLALVVTGSEFFVIIRALRLLRVFRVFKLVRMMNGAEALFAALKASRAKIIVFISFVFILVTILGTLMYVVEGGENGYDSIPKSIYWAIVTLTTVGYGDIVPVTVLGQIMSSMIMILGYGIIAVPTGIVGAEIYKSNFTNSQSCSNCSFDSHANDAIFCKRCGSSLK